MSIPLTGAAQQTVSTLQEMSSPQAHSLGLLRIFRHGQSTWNAERRWQGQADPPLSEQGVSEANAAGELLRAEGIVSHSVLASDLERARHTAEIIASYLGAEVQIDARLRERHAGAWQGLTHDEIRAEYPGWLEEQRRPDGFESDSSIMGRVGPALNDAITTSTSLIISHGGVMRLIARSYGITNLIPRNLDRIELQWPPNEGGTCALVPTLEDAEISVEAESTTAAGDSERI